MQITNCTLADIEKISELYEVARQYQKIKSATIWPIFSHNLIETDINEKRQYKIIIDNEIACIWTLTYKDPQIWEEKDNIFSIYIHRIATNPSFRGQNLVAIIIKWAKEYAQENNKKLIRLDTVGKNLGLISHYEKLGFEYLGLFDLKDTSELPEHYHNAAVSLFELSV
ncbi:GNAT family N-acetyltransferase [Flavobacterium sp. ov086]|uniref:GNAT family N-acetyltransferase n=1 Tax=Flavobacterium sp. ov086 TaxID=1761785 RepID=UPI000B6E30D7|nr:GNAT family N-acetyltransferase [Flavobacterium sp. ov086]SNR38965.1 Acetyltransferase (GNAT) family protein [Flavobacterium sp. ov086]